MIGLGTIINVAGIILGGVLGKIFGRFLSERYQDTLAKACGISVLFIGIAGALEEMFTINGSQISGGKSMLIVACLTLGVLVGEFLNLENKFEKITEPDMYTDSVYKEIFDEAGVAVLSDVEIAAKVAEKEKQVGLTEEIRNGQEITWSILK